ncbi:TldD/PmbA family protein [Neobittarella massiliensis]|uniref:TldD/PmbA family protein n=1 Tax=Neobittarella massiliensis (ex Bilen et al. 2018) TaxID=2041842 RepID=A0A8J6IQC9_9FIRM|nr:TldD/PmbA family protein [Neobittarella massiliensis]MBC3516982.1 TldD/PmbA family protein [Neobittarella massiliensis]
MSTGADFAELFYEDSLSHSLNLIDRKVESAVRGHIRGVGIRAIKGLHSVYVSSCDMSPAALITAAKQAAVACCSGQPAEFAALTALKADGQWPKIEPAGVESAKKAHLLRRADAAARDYSAEIAQVSAMLMDKTQDVLIANTQGLYVEDRRVRTRFYISAIAADGTQNQTGSEGPGASCGYELFERLDVCDTARSAARQAVTMLHATECPAGVMPVAIENGFGGVIFHEACGHSLESAAVGKGNSEFAGKLGQKIASSKVTAIDDGTIPGAWGSTAIDDEGRPTQRTVLIENGILKSYMVDYLGSLEMGLAPTGSGRRESYLYAPTSRMRNTYIAPGKDRDEDIIASMERGLYCKKMGGGSVNPVTGEFNFAVSEGYLVENGKIRYPVRGASLIGKGSQVLFDIDMVGRNLDHGQGMCGAASGSVPTNVGQPLIRLQKITVGGKQ